MVRNLVQSFSQLGPQHAEEITTQLNPHTLDVVWSDLEHHELLARREAELHKSPFVNYHEMVELRAETVVRQPGVREHDRARGDLLPDDGQQGFCSPVRDDEEERPVRFRLLVWTKQLTFSFLQVLVELDG